MANLLCRCAISSFRDLCIYAQGRLRVRVTEADLRSLNVNPFFHQERRGRVFQIMESQIAQSGPISGR